MRKTSILLLSLTFIILCYFTFVSAKKVFRSDWQLSQEINHNVDQHRLVLITQDMETSFWDQVESGARKQALKEGASLEVWGSYGNNQEDFLEKIEIALYSKVDGIIVQGLDNEDFKDLTKIKASFYGIPIITVANDVPMSESFRRTFVGSDQYQAGRMLANELTKEMGTSGTVVLMYDSEHEYYQSQRLSGIQDVLNVYPNIKTVLAQTSETREQVLTTTQDVMNRNPDVDAFIAVNANFSAGMVQEIGKRSQVEPYFIYSFDDGPETLTLLKEEKLDGIVKQSPEMMGEISVQLIMQWLNGETVPLNIDGYFTDIHFLKAVDVQ
ncbi:MULTISPECIES: sugar ABC transporter substrate-binding protein [Robertmurraya]|uniref:Sugar ABC transporter substrate-binding protein n=1 Tax=Robertmurraya beringensis TaxID=641660 RepID=A0ABV6KSW8_9BACI|nr:periplasmic binding protein/LacI transcriptional regulator [Mycobacteroides abscessus subsp. abscessus]